MRLLSKVLHPFLWLGVVLIRKDKLIVVNSQYLRGVEQAIFVANHSNGYDFPTLGEVVRKQFYILADYTMKNDFAVNLLNRSNGCIYVDRLSKQSRNDAKEEMLRLLKRGENILLFPEGTWNLTESKMLRPLNWGVIDLSQNADVPIIPIAISYAKGKRVCRIGKPLRFSKQTDKKTAIDCVERRLTSIFWKAMERTGIHYRTRLPRNVFESWRRDALRTYRRFDVRYEEKVIRKAEQ